MENETIAELSNFDPTDEFDDLENVTCVADSRYVSNVTAMKLALFCLLLLEVAAVALNSFCLKFIRNSPKIDWESKALLGNVCFCLVLKSLCFACQTALNIDILRLADLSSEIKRLLCTVIQTIIIAALITQTLICAFMAISVYNRRRKENDAWWQKPGSLSSVIGVFWLFSTAYMVTITVFFSHSHKCLFYCNYAIVFNRESVYLTFSVVILLLVASISFILVTYRSIKSKMLQCTINQAQHNLHDRLVMLKNLYATKCVVPWLVCDVICDTVGSSISIMLTKHHSGFTPTVTTWLGLAQVYLMVLELLVQPIIFICISRELKNQVILYFVSLCSSGSAVSPDLSPAKRSCVMQRSEHRATF